MNNLKDNFIGLFDSGFGGISNLNFCLKAMPNENYVFYADSENCPYGKKDRSQIIEIGKDIISKFYAYRPKALIIACNTMSTSDPVALREPFPNLKIIGTYPNFEHLLKPGTVLEEHSFQLYKNEKYISSVKKLRVLIIATTATCKSDYLREKMDLYKDLIDVYAEPADMIVKAVENAEVDKMYLKNYLKGLFIPYKDVDHLILGCTHFNFAKDVIRKILGNKVNITSGSEISVDECYKYMKDNHLLNNSKAHPYPDGKYTIKIVDAHLNKKRKDTFLRLLDYDKDKYNIDFVTSLK